MLLISRRRAEDSKHRAGDGMWTWNPNLSQTLLHREIQNAYEAD